MASYVDKPRNLLSSAQVVTDSWADVGDPLSVGYFDTLIARPEVKINSSNNVRFRVIERVLTPTGGTEYVPAIETISADVVKVEDRYVELNADADQNIILQFDVKGLEYAILQAQAGTVGATGASVESCYYNFVQDR